MAKIIQIRNVPDDVHRELKVRAAANGQSLSDYLLDHVARVAARPAIADVLQRAGNRPGGVVDSETIVAAIREGRPD
ncbi:MAG: FitA-like ribbon-helix-helix domain-containing protein [Acidimicrobiales bacterium]